MGGLLRTLGPSAVRPVAEILDEQSVWASEALRAWLSQPDNHAMVLEAAEWNVEKHLDWVWTEGVRVMDQRRQAWLETSGHDCTAARRWRRWGGPVHRLLMRVPWWKRHLERQRMEAVHNLLIDELTTYAATLQLLVHLGNLRVLVPQGAPPGP
jgi:hypothetical protein